LAPIADLSEGKIEVLAITTNPISDSFCKRLLDLLLLALALKHHDLVFIWLLIRILHVLVLLVIVWADDLPVSHILERDLFDSLINLLVFIILIDDHLTIHQVWALSLRGLLSLFEEMLRLPVEVLLWFDFLASVALETAVEIIILALAADPATIWEVKLIIQRLLL